MKVLRRHHCSRRRYHHSLNPKVVLLVEKIEKKTELHEEPLTRSGGWSAEYEYTTDMKMPVRNTADCWNLKINKLEKTNAYGNY
mmetsp:Transcript_19952/g.39608  ORF Transcript_19952/g.39608 Transcript_19952/m.39608 type:complete len:84 (+) Transcript_19952:1180-1431(+)